MSLLERCSPCAVLVNSITQLDDTLLLIEPAAALAYEERKKAVEPKPPIPGGTGDGGHGNKKVIVDPPPPLPPPAKACAFHGTAEVNAASAKYRLAELADEIISLLASDPNATVRVTLEIDADFPKGVSDHVKRAVSENANALGLKNKTWE